MIKVETNIGYFRLNTSPTSSAMAQLFLHLFTVLLRKSFLLETEAEHGDSACNQSTLRDQDGGSVEPWSLRPAQRTQ